MIEETGTPTADSSEFDETECVQAAVDAVCERLGTAPFSADELQPDPVPAVSAPGNRVFYTFPPDVLEIIVRGIGEEAFDAEGLARERQMSQFVGDHAAYVGVVNGTRVPFGLLRLLAVDPDGIEQGNAAER